MIGFERQRSNPNISCLGAPAELGRRMWIRIVRDRFGVDGRLLPSVGDQDYSKLLLGGVNASVLTCQVLEVRMSVAEPSPARPSFVVAPSRRRVGTQSPLALQLLAGTWLLGEESVFVLPSSQNHETPIGSKTRFHVRVGISPETHCIVGAATDCQHLWLALEAVASVVSFFRGWSCPNVIAKIEYEGCGRVCVGVRANQLTAGRGIAIYQTDHGLMDDDS